MSQQQHTIPLQRADGTVGEATRTGNNAAWLCSCGRSLPLLGYSDALDAPQAYSAVVCPDCQRAYQVAAPGLKQVPTYVQEIEREHS
jgi:hypothetical protein